MSLLLLSPEAISNSFQLSTTCDIPRFLNLLACLKPLDPSFTARALQILDAHLQEWKQACDRETYEKVKATVEAKLKELCIPHNLTL